jgi:hypothetical protein
VSHPEDLGEVHWLVPLEDPVDLPTDTDADEFVHHLRASASERFGATGAKAAWDAVPFPHHAWQPTGCESRSQLWIARSEDHLHLFVTGPEPLLEEAAIWQEALAAAKELLGGSGTAFQWAAILGPDPDDLLAGPPTFESFTTGHLSVRPARSALSEWRETSSGLAGRQSAMTWPVIVEGTNSGYVWDAACRIAAREVRRLCALLSVASGHPWVLRQSPTMAEPGILDLPDVLPAPEGFDPPELGVGCPRLEVPHWLPTANVKLDADEELCNALLAYHEGILLKRGHPSLAAVAFVAALDGIGRRHASGSKNRVKAAAARVLSEEEASALVDAYELRCSTVHEGVMHGGEVLGGVFTMPRFLSRDEASEFVWGSLRRLEQAAQAVIVQLLAEGP